MDDSDIEKIDKENYDWVDKEGELVLTYEIMVYCHKKRVMCLGMSGSATSKFYDLVKDGKINTLTTEYLWDNNVIVTLTGEALIDMIKKFYSDKLTEAKDSINPSEEYTIDCYDMS